MNGKADGVNKGVNMANGPDIFFGYRQAKDGGKGIDRPLFGPYHNNQSENQLSSNDILLAMLERKAESALKACQDHIDRVWPELATFQEAQLKRGEVPFRVYDTHAVNGVITGGEDGSFNNAGHLDKTR